MTSDFEWPLRVAALLAGFERPWFVAGGWAIDLFLGRVTRPHKDIEIAIFRADQQAIRAYLAGWQFAKAAGGQWSPWDGTWLALPAHQLRARGLVAGDEKLDILLNEAEQGAWHYRRNLAIARPLSSVALRSDLGVPYLSPEIVLLYKAKGPRAQDQADFVNAVDLLGAERRAWLTRNIQACYPDCPWLAHL
jgi:hypothetical protein